MKEKFIKSTIILIIGGIFTKIFSMFIRIISTRIIGTEGIGLYMMILPSFNLFITIATLSFPLSISKLVAEEKRSSKSVVFSIVPLALLLNIIIIIFVILLAPYIANTLLKNNQLYYPILATAVTLPFITLSGILRGYFFGKQRMIPSVFSNIVEQVVRILCILIIVPKTLKFGLSQAVTSLVITNIVSEFFSIIVLLLFLPKDIIIRKKDLVPSSKNIKNTLEISIPTTTGRVISSIALFLEPIIITYAFTKLGYTTGYITKEYGIITGYVLPIVTLPSFLSSAISSALLPVITNKYQNNDMIFIKKRIRQAIVYSLIIGIPCTLIILLFPNIILKVMFGEVVGKNYLLFASLIFLITYINGPIISSLQAMDKSKNVLYANIINAFIKIVCLLLFSILNIKMYSLLFAYLISFVITTIYEFYELKKVLNKN